MIRISEFGTAPAILDNSGWNSAMLDLREERRRFPDGEQQDRCPKGEGEQQAR
jgi:hypothetical protein